MLIYHSLSDQLSKFISELATTTNDSSSSSSSSSSSEVLQWCATGVWPNCSGQYSWALVPKTAQSYADLCSAWPQLAAVDSPTVQQAGYSAYLVVLPAELAATAATAAVAPAAVAQPAATQYGVPQHRPSGCDAPWALQPPPLPPVRANSAAAPAAVAMSLYSGHSGSSGVHGSAGVQSPVLPMIPPLHAPLLRQLTPEAFRQHGTATAAVSDNSRDIDALHRVTRRHSSSSGDSVQSASSGSSAKQYSSSAAQQQQHHQGSKRPRSPPAAQRRDGNSSSSSSATSSSYRHRTSYGDEISYKSFAADAQCDDSRRQHSSHSSDSGVSSSYKHAAHKNDDRDEKRARYDSRSSASDFNSKQVIQYGSSRRHSRSRSRSSSRERFQERDRYNKQSEQPRKRSCSAGSYRSDESSCEREATRQRSSSMAEQRYAKVQPLTALSSTEAYNARKQARAAAVAAAKAGSSSTAAAAAVAAVAAVEPSVVSPAASATLLPAAHTDLCAELNSNAVAVLPPVSLPMQPVRMFVGTSVLPQCEPVLTATHSNGQAAAAAAVPIATVGAALVQPCTSSSSSAQLHDTIVASADPADAFARGCAQVSSNGPVQCPPSWSYASSLPKVSALTGTASTQPCVMTKQP
jgi:hypothetical protein